MVSDDTSARRLSSLDLSDLVGGCDEPTLDDYRNAPSGIGPLAREWRDKPHRLIYSLIRLVEDSRRAAPDARPRLTLEGQ